MKWGVLYGDDGRGTLFCGGKVNEQYSLIIRGRDNGGTYGLVAFQAPYASSRCSSVLRRPTGGPSTWGRVTRMVGPDPPSESKGVPSSIVEIGSQYKLGTVGLENISRWDLGDANPPPEASFSEGRDRHHNKLSG